MVSDAESGPQTKTVSYTVPLHTMSARVELYSRENPTRPLVCRELAPSVSTQTGVLTIGLSDRCVDATGAPRGIGEDCIARLVGTAIDNSGMMQSLFAEDGLPPVRILAEGSWKDVPHGSPQHLVLGAGESTTLDYASFPDAQSDLIWSFERAFDRTIFSGLQI